MDKIERCVDEETKNTIEKTSKECQKWDHGSMKICEDITVINLGASKVFDLGERKVRSQNFESWLLKEQGHY